MVAQYPIQIARKVASGIAMAAFWIEGHNPIRAAANKSICARVTIFRLGRKGEKETGQLALSVQLFLNRTPSHVSTDEVADVHGILCAELEEIARYEGMPVAETGDGCSNRVLRMDRRQPSQAYEICRPARRQRPRQGGEGNVGLQQVSLRAVVSLS